MSCRRVIVSTDDNPMFLAFWPLVATMWSRFGFLPCLALVTDRPEHKWDWMRQFGIVVRYRPRSDLPPATWAKLARWQLYYRWPDDKCITACIDMLPLLREYYVSLFEHADTSLVLASYDAYPGLPGIPTEERKFPGCYMVATGKTWQEIINPRAVDAHEWIMDVQRAASGDPNTNVMSPEFSEESLLRPTVYRWATHQSSRIVKLCRPGGWGPFAGHRIDRYTWQWKAEGARNGWYIDCHCLRPLSEHRQAVCELVEAYGIDIRLVDIGIEGAKCAS